MQREIKRYYVEDLGPPFCGDNLEDSEESFRNRIKISEAIV
jgi:hypothetical protein